MTPITTSTKRNISGPYSVSIALETCVVRRFDLDRVMEDIAWGYAKCLTECDLCSDHIRDAYVACAKCHTKVHRHCFDTYMHYWTSNDDDEVADQARGLSSFIGISTTNYLYAVCQAFLHV